MVRGRAQEGGKSVNERYRALIAQMLLRTYRDAVYGVGRRSIVEFIASDWCEMLCEYVSIDYVNYRDKVLTALRDNKRQVATLHGRA
jgi:hypothetical protein